MQFEPEIHPSQHDRQLPMIVNLRGDEDHAEDFCIDAEQAMEKLGIKRSRLTQISGRELRVGRVRRDRYIRPFYRESDLQDYQEWTRATATHQSSSKAIEQAIDSLDDRFNDLFVVLHERLEQFQLRENEFLRDRFASLHKQLHRQLQELGSDLGSARQIGEQSQRQGELLLKAQRGLDQRQERAGAVLEESRQRLEIFHQDLREALLRLNLLRRDIEGISPRLLAHIDAQSEQQTNAQQDLELTITKILNAGELRLRELVQAEFDERLVKGEAETDAAQSLRPRPRIMPQRRRRQLSYLQN